MSNSSVSPQKLANAIRALAMDSIQKAKSGHPGMPLGMADIAVALWTRHLRHNPKDPIASFCRTDTARCSSTRCCTSRATIFRWMI